jgi:hypothetical protein
MNCNDIAPLVADYLRGTLEKTSREKMDVHLSGCAKCQEELRSMQRVWTDLSSLPEAAPSAGLDFRIQALIEGYREGMDRAEREPQSTRGGSHWLEWIWPARSAPRFAIALALVAVGSLLGLALGRPGPNSISPAPKSNPAIAQLRDEVSSMKQLVMLSLLQQQSASERLQGIGWSYRMERVDDRVFTALLNALDSDPNVNVRLAAVDALHQFSSDAAVRKGLLHSLSAQESPLVQIELINLLVELKEKDSAPVLNQLLREP